MIDTQAMVVESMEVVTAVSIALEKMKLSRLGLITGLLAIAGGTSVSILDETEEESKEDMRRFLVAAIRKLAEDVNTWELKPKE